MKNHIQHDDVRQWKYKDEMWKHNQNNTFITVISMSKGYAVAKYLPKAK